jgi:heme/copper-type cytochrome/quinol oxidase subunit 2
MQVVQNGPILEEKMPRLGLGQIILLMALLAMLALAVGWAAMVWNTGENQMNKHGWIALGVGTFFSLVIGCGLMALMFFSQRSGHDDAADPFRKREEPDREV